MPRRKIPMSERTHGVPNTYKAGCRCADCTSAASAYAKERAKARQAGDVRTAQGEPTGRRHGARSTYKAGCRCDLCTEAQSAYNRDRREKAKAEETQPEVIHELRIAATCPKCGSGFVQQTEWAFTDSGLRSTLMLKCADRTCRWEWQFVGVLMSRTATEYAGAAG